MTTQATRAGASREIPVWDLFVRVGHWVLVATFFIAFFTEDDLLTLHSWAGYVVAGVVALRVIWGVIGPRRARFTDFVYGPAAVLKYLRDLIGFRAERHLGHSPAGGAMVMALLLSLTATTLSGMAVLAEEEGRGPLAPWLGAAIESVSPVTAAWADDDEDRRGRGGRRGGGGGGGESAYKDIHEVLANLSLLLVILHVGGVILASVAHRENLAWSMVTGRKRPLDRDGG